MSTHTTTTCTQYSSVCTFIQVHTTTPNAQLYLRPMLLYHNTNTNRSDNNNKLKPTVRWLGGCSEKWRVVR